MNKNNLHENHSSAINVSALCGSMLGKRVLVLDKYMPTMPYSTLKAFFDVIIAVGEEAAEYCIQPDIFISTRLNPHVNGILDLTPYNKYRYSILCITHSEVAFLLKMAKYHTSHVLLWQPMDVPLSELAAVYKTIPYGLNAEDPGVHLAMIAGSTNIYSSSIYKDELDTRLDKLINAKRGYMPANILRPTRPPFLEEAKFIG
jgi:hypothetical protein